jgi:hypothetical protein
MKNENVFAALAKVILMLVNMAFMVAGCLLIYFSNRVKKSGWLDAFDGGDNVWLGKSTFLAVLIIGAIVIATAFVGCFGAWLRNHLFLTIYAILLFGALVFFVILLIGANSTKSKVTGWEYKNFPADDSENKVAQNLNKMYCFAQVPYYCSEASIMDVVKIFRKDTSKYQQYFGQGQSNITAVCALGNTPSDLNTICDICSEINKYTRYTSVLDWANSECPRTVENQAWCGLKLATNNVTIVDKGAPYGQCRTAFLDLVKTWSGAVFVVCLIAAISITAVFVFTYILRRESKASNQQDYRYSRW